MKKLSIFYLVNCPYCMSAKRAVKELQEEGPEYSGIEIEWIDEGRISSYPSWCSHYYVPSIYCDEKKLYEADPRDDSAAIRSSVKKAFDFALGKNE